MTGESPQANTRRSNEGGSATGEASSGGVIYNKKMINFKIDCLPVKLQHRKSTKWKTVAADDAIVNNNGGITTDDILTNSVEERNGGMNQLTVINNVSAYNAGADIMNRNQYQQIDSHMSISTARVQQDTSTDQSHLLQNTSITARRRK